MVTDAATELELLLSDRVGRIESLLEIENKERELVPFNLFRIQKDMIETQTGRDVYVKPGQVGASSGLIGDYLLDCLTIPGTVSVILSHEEFITTRLLGKAQSFYNSLKQRIPSIPELHNKSANLKTFEFGSVESSFYIGSSRAYVFGRGETIHNLLCDEYGFWEAASIERIMAPIMQRVPLGGRIAILSTPNGQDNDFFEVYMAAKEGKEIGKSIFTSHFYPWFWHEEYTLPITSPYVLPGDNIEFLELIPDEQKLIRDSGVTLDQIRWRRRKIAEMESLRRSGETRILFGQEFPENDVDCFLVAGDMAYDSDLINEMAKKCGKPNSTVANLHTWYPPEPDLKYIVSIDPGVAKESETVLTVWRFYREDGNEWAKHCASLGGLIMPEVIANRAVEIAKMYNGALITWDYASQGMAVASGLKNYGNIYRRRDVFSGRLSPQEIGWLTTPRTKQYMYSQMVKMLPYVITHDIRIVSQLRNMRYDMDKGRLFAVGMDDYHDSAAIAICCRESMPITRGYAGRSGWDW